jgi:hypothetical protein
MPPTSALAKARTDGSEWVRTEEAVSTHGKNQQAWIMKLHVLFPQLASYLQTSSHFPNPAQDEHTALQCRCSSPVSLWHPFHSAAKISLWLLCLQFVTRGRNSDIQKFEWFPHPTTQPNLIDFQWELEWKPALIMWLGISIPSFLSSSKVKKLPHVLRALFKWVNEQAN